MDFLQSKGERIRWFSKLDSHAEVEGVRSFYLGIDLTFRSLHIGHILPLLWMNRFQQLSPNHRGYILLGDYTSLIGDPTGKLKERPSMSYSTIMLNFIHLLRQVKLICPGLSVIHNSMWLKHMQLGNFIEVCSRFSVTEMMGWETFKRRRTVNGRIGLSEMMYPVLQAYDFWWLNRHLNVNVQLAGIDQINNVKLGRRMIGKDVHGAFFPLICDARGRKYSKSSPDGLWMSSEIQDDYQFCFFAKVKHAHACEMLAKFLDFTPVTLLCKMLILRGMSPKNASLLARFNAKKFGHPITFGGRLSDFLLKFCGLKNVSAARYALRSGQVMVNEVAAVVTAPLKAGDGVTFGGLKFVLI